MKFKTIQKLFQLQSSLQNCTSSGVPEEFTPDCYSRGTPVLLFFRMIYCIDPVLMEWHSAET